MAEPPGGCGERAALTSGYLDLVRRHGARAGELTRRLRGSELLDGLYRGRYLSRPVFLGPLERERLDADLANVEDALFALPDRLSGGDFAAFASAMGLSGYALAAVLRGRSGGAGTRLARADLYTDQAGFRLLEFNVGSAVGGMDNAELCRGLLAHPVLARHARERRLRFADTGRALIETIFAETGLPRRPRPVVALANWPGHYERLARYMRALAVRWQAAGLDTRACHLGQLRPRRGRLWLGDAPVDLIYRMFPLAQLDRPEAPALIEPVLDALAAGAVSMFTPLDTEVLGSKAALAALCSGRGMRTLTPAGRSSVRRLVPWTAAVADGPVATADGRRADLLDYAITHQRELVLKPSAGHGGEGVLPGWDPATTGQAWRGRLESALRGGHVLQRRVRPAPEPFPDDRGGLAPWIVAWGAFRMAGSSAGYYARAVPVAASRVIVNRDAGASVGGCLTG